jgi:hypothetical protein
VAAIEEMVEASGDSSLLPLQHFTVIFKQISQCGAGSRCRQAHPPDRHSFNQKNNLHEAGLQLDSTYGRRHG